jgi:hypothetical protein
LAKKSQNPEKNCRDFLISKIFVRFFQSNLPLGKNLSLKLYSERRRCWGYPSPSDHKLFKLFVLLEEFLSFDGFQFASGVSQISALLFQFHDSIYFSVLGKNKTSILLIRDFLKTLHFCTCFSFSVRSWRRWTIFVCNLQNEYQRKYRGALKIK